MAKPEVCRECGYDMTNIHGEFICIKCSPHTVEITNLEYQKARSDTNE